MNEYISTAFPVDVNLQKNKQTNKQMAKRKQTNKHRHIDVYKLNQR